MILYGPGRLTALGLSELAAGIAVNVITNNSNRIPEE